MTNPLTKIEQTQPFTATEAWKLFRLAAIGEAIGWTLLISGIYIKYDLLGGNDIPVLVAGQIHGILFITYFVALVALYSSLRWSRKRTLVALMAGVPPFGSLVFEQWAAYKRRSAALKDYRQVTVRAIIVRRHELLVVQPKDSGYYYLPGGAARAGETAEEALRRIAIEQTGITPTIGHLVYVSQSRDKSTEHLELFFVVSNTQDFFETKLKQQLITSRLLDDIRYVDPSKNADVRPAFLQTEPVVALVQKSNQPVQIVTSG